MTYEGPDVYCSVRVPDGVHMVSLYFMNKDGHSGLNRLRDYTVEVACNSSNDLVPSDHGYAHSRVRMFWRGVYLRFAVAGPGEFQIRIRRTTPATK